MPAPESIRLLVEERQIEAVDGQIDALVYELYGLAEEEVRVVEGEECELYPMEWTPVKDTYNQLGDQHERKAEETASCSNWMQMYENGEKSMAQVERELGITEGLLAKWRDELQARQGSEPKPFLGMVIYLRRKTASGNWNERMPSCGRRKRS